MNSTSIPPRNTRNKIYENQKEGDINPVVKAINNVCNRRARPMAKGWFMKRNTEDRIIIIIINIEVKITEISL
jgi:hypothetical protein